LGFDKPKGNPKYVKGRDPMEHPKVWAKEFILSVSILIGIIRDLAKFTLRPVEVEKLLSKVFRKSN
jgi:hypothetical protein